MVGLSWRNLGHALGSAGSRPRTGACSISARRTPGAKEKGPLVALDRKGEVAADQAAARAGLKGMVVLDGNWAQAKALWWRNAWLTRLRRFVIVPDGPSLYGDLRREARPDAVSTLEADGTGTVACWKAIRRCAKSCWSPFRDMLAKARAAGRSGQQTGSSRRPVA